jgi:hypothetical protein
MKKIIVSLTIISFAVLACKKYNQIQSDADSKLYIYGRVFVEDSINDNGIIKPLLKVTPISISYKNDSVAILKTTNTSDSGYFSFSNMKKDAEYVIIAQAETGSGDSKVFFSGSVNVLLNESKTNITPLLKLDNSKQNGIHLIVLDNTGGKISNITAWVFNNPSLFAADTSAGKIFDMVTNPYGVSNKFNISQGRYFLRIKTRIGNIDLKGEGVIDIENTGIKTLVITVFQNQNGFELVVFDNQNAPVNNAQVYGYRSLTVSQLDSNNTNSIFILNTSASGGCSLYNIDPARYYLKTIKQIGAIVLKSEDVIDVNNNMVATKTIRLN